jgi:hypothetical protein
MRRAYTGRMPRRVLLLSTLLLAVAPAARADDGGGQLMAQEAIATSLANGALVYREEHLLRGDAGRPLERLVLFRCPGGAAFARKRIDYAQSASAPAFAFEDARTGYREGLRRKAAGDELYFRERAGASERLALLPARAQVADAGFDEFVRAHWQALAAGESVPLRFAVPARLGSLDFRVRQAGARQVDGEPALVFRLRLDGLLGFVAPHIDVAYSARSRRLLRFEGMSNLRDDDGRGQFEVRIDFPAPAQPTGAGRWAAALSEPLVARCESGQAADSPRGRTPATAR